MSSSFSYEGIAVVKKSTCPVAGSVFSMSWSTKSLDVIGFGVEDVVITADGVAGLPEDEMIVAKDIFQLAIGKDRALQQACIAKRF